MAAAENVNTTDPEEQTQEVYPSRSQEDLESIINEMEEVENEEIEESVREISSLADGNLREGRTGVTEHFEAPIRSLNNPTENTVELEDGTTAEVVGEEYFLGQNLPGFQDVGNIKWWTIMDENSYREETRNGGLEHLQLNNEGEIHSYRVELDGEPLNPEQVQRLERNLNIRAQGQVTTENRVVEDIIQYSSREEILENEDLTEDEYIQQVKEAQEYGLINEDGELTLKGFITGQDMEARDLRALDNASNGAETIETSTQGVLDNFSEGSFNESIELRFTGFARDLENMRLEADSSDGEITVPNSGFGRHISIDENGMRIGLENNNVPASAVLNEYFPNEVVENGEVNIPELEQRNPDLAGSLIQRAEISNNNVEYSDASGQASLNLYTPEDEPEEPHREMLESEFGLSIEELSKELENNSSIEVEEENITITYEGDEIPERLVKGIEKKKSPKWEDGEIDISHGLSAINSTAQLVLHQFEEELDEKHDYNTSSSRVYERISAYQDISTELDQKIQELEETGIIKTEVIEREPAKVSLNPEDKEDYRLIDRLSSETDLDLPSEIKELSTENLETETARIGRDMRDIEDLDEELEEYKEEITSLIAENTSRKVWENIGRGKEFDYAAEGLKRKIHEFIDSRDNGLLKGLHDLMGRTPEKERVREDIGPAYGNLKFTTPEGAELAEYLEESMAAASEDLYEKLEELEEEGLLELKYRDQTEMRIGREETEVLDYEGEFEIENYHEMDEEDKEMLKKLEEEDVLELEDSRSELDIEENHVSYDMTFDTESQSVDVSDEEIRVRGEYQQSTSYDVNDQIREIGEQLNPTNFDSDPYEDVIVENDFEYGEEITA